MSCFMNWNMYLFVLPCHLLFLMFLFLVLNKFLRVKKRAMMKMMMKILVSNQIYFLWISNNNHQLVKWSFPLIFTATKDWTGLWIVFPNWARFHQLNCFQAANFICLQNGKKAMSCQKWLLGVLKKIYKIHMKTPMLVCSFYMLLQKF